MLQLQWIKSKASNWLSLESCDLSDVSTAGVYIIWHGGNPARVVKVGSGDIAARLSAHRNDKAILTYRSFGTLYVTWAAVTGTSSRWGRALSRRTLEPTSRRPLSRSCSCACDQPF